MTTSTPLASDGAGGAGKAMLPLLAPRDPDAPIAWRDGEPASARQWLHDVQSLAARLSHDAAVVNLCADRYAFSVGLGAALMRGQPSVLPPNAMPQTLERLRESYPRLHAVADDDVLGAAEAPQARPHPGVGASALAIPAIDAGQPGACLLTSGSTGDPQPHPKTWGMLVANAKAAARRLADLLGRPSLEALTLVATVPPQHSYGFESSVLLALQGGAAFDSGRPFFAADIAAALERVPRPRALVITPFHLKMLLGSRVRIPAADLVLCATAPLSPQLAQQAEQAFGAALIEIYGCTEAGQVATRRTAAGPVWHTFDGLHIRAETEAGSEGFIVQGGYVPEPTALADILELDDSEHFRLLGRANDLIHVAGKRSSLAHLNYHLNSIEGVDDGAFWLPDEVEDEVVRPVAFVVAPELDAKQIAAALRERLEPAFVPRRIVHVDALPREPTGKLTAQALRRFALARLAAAESEANVGSSDEPASLTAGNDGIVVTRQVPREHPAFDGHFPGQPLLPGVALLAEVLEALRGGAVPASAGLGPTPTFSVAKFHAPVLPGSTLRVVFRATASGLRFEVFSAAAGADPVLAASGQLAPGAATPSSI